MFARSPPRSLTATPRSAHKRVVMAAAPTEAVAFPHQADLPPLPVPTLEDTCARYLDSVRPLLSETELQHTEAVVAEVRHIGLSGPRQVCNSHV